VWVDLGFVGLVGVVLFVVIDEWYCDLLVGMLLVYVFIDLFDCVGELVFGDVW